MMRRLLYIILAFVLAACSQEIFPEDALILPDYPNSASEIAPAASMCPADLPPAATRALVDISTITSMEANVLKIDEDKDKDDGGLYTFGSWESAYLAESSISSPASASSGSFRTMRLNPVQAYSYKVDEGETDTTFYHTRMISWYPRTATLHKSDEGKAPVMRFSDFKAVNQNVYDKAGNGKVVLNFNNLDGSKDVMVSNIVEGQHWHTNNGTDLKNEVNTYTYPFGHNDSNPTYSNVMTYKHYLAAVKVYAYALDSDQVVSMWGALRSVVVRNQPSQISVTLPDPGEMRDADIENHVQKNALDYGPASFSGSVDFPLIKTAMYESETDDPNDPGIAEDSPLLVQGKRIYLGYALVKPWTEGRPNLELDVHTDAGVLSLSVPMKQTIKKTEDGVTTEHDVTIQAGYIYHIDVSFNTEGAVADIVLQSDDDNYYDLSAGMELADGIHDYQYANCYVVHPDIKRYRNAEKTVYDYYDGYAFLATKVGSATAKIYPEFASDRTTKDIDPVRAGLLWETSPGLVTQVELLYGYIRFKVQPPKIKDGEGNWIDNPLYREGNAVIAAYDSQRKVLWSWHIWVTDKPADVTFGTGNTAITLLDRNLGATASDASTTASNDDGSLLETYGLYYQWGRKDPSMGPEVANYRPQSTATAPYYDYYGMKWDYAGVVTMDRPGIRDGVENPMYLVLPTDFSMTTYQYDWMYTHVDNLWGDYLEKTIYDPCPFDYMVPQDEISTLFAKTRHTYESGRGMYINNSLFPFAGYKGVDKGVSSLSGAWKYVGAKGDYMSAKIEQNGHRSRTYISDSSSWVEYGADADNDGDGDASRSYSSRINADDMANRRTAASVRCVKMHYGAKGSLSASFVGDKSYSFIADNTISYDPGSINFTYKINAIGENVTISMGHIDAYNGETELLTFYIPGEASGQTNYSGTWTTPIPDAVGTGVVRYRLVANASNAVVSRISYTLRLFDIAGLKIGDEAYSSETTVTPGQKYGVSFTLKGLESDFTVLVNGAVATRGEVATAGEMPYTVSGIGIPGHLHIQIIDADGNLACEKSYPVKQSSNIEVTYTVDVANKITDVTKLEAGKPYFFRLQTMYYSNYYCFVYKDGKLSWQKCTHDCMLIVDDVQNTDAVVPAANVFYYHKDDTKIYNVGYSKQSAGALFSPAANGFLKDDFTFGPDNEAVYVTCANPSSYNTYAQLYSSVTGDQLYYDPNPDALTYKWGWLAIAYPSKWEIYPVIVTTSN